MKKLLLLISFALTINSVKAQWQSNGPYGAIINCLAVSGSNIFAGTNGEGVFLSSNNCTSWTQVNKGLPPQMNIAAIAGTWQCKHEAGIGCIH